MHHFDSDYMEGVHPAILERMAAENFAKHDGYGCDPICDSARRRIREACGAPDAEIHLLTGGTQTNATMIKALLRPYEGVVAADTGHINVHEAGAVEATGHKVLALPHTDGRLAADTVARCVDAFLADGNRDHMVWPGMVYISQPTEYGTLYSLAELEALSRVCRDRAIPLYMDGARLAYALAAPACDMTLHDAARLCDAFYIGGTKCGALFGEALVFPKPALAQGFAYARKQRGGLLAKGRMLGVQFEALLAPGVYERIGAHENALADRLRQGIAAAGYGFVCQTRTNQLFPVFPDALVERLEADFGFHRWGAAGEGRTAVRLVTSWSTQAADVEAFLRALA